MKTKILEYDLEEIDIEFTDVKGNLYNMSVGGDLELTDSDKHLSIRTASFKLDRFFGYKYISPKKDFRINSKNILSLKIKERRKDVVKIKKTSKWFGFVIKFELLDNE